MSDNIKVKAGHGSSSSSHSESGASKKSSSGNESLSADVHGETESARPPREKQSGGQKQGSGANAGKANTSANQSGSSLDRHIQRLALFDHLPRKQPTPSVEEIDGCSSLHSSTIKLGLLYKKGIIREDDDRAAALISLFCNIIEDYKTPPNKSLSWDLDKHIRAQVSLSTPFYLFIHEK